MIRFVGIQGKRSIEAHFDPELNSLFHAFDALGNRIGHKFWKERRDRLPLGYQGGFEFVPYREIAPPPSDETAALTLIRSVIEQHVGPAPGAAANARNPSKNAEGGIRNGE